MRSSRLQRSPDAVSRRLHACARRPLAALRVLVALAWAIVAGACTTAAVRRSLERSDAAMRTGAYADARRELDAALARHPERAALWEGRAELDAARGRWSDAIDAWERARALVGPSEVADLDCRLGFARANALVVASAEREALTRCATSARAEPWRLAARGRLRELDGSLDEATARYDEALAIDGDLGVAALGRARALVSLHREAEAFDVLVVRVDRAVRGAWGSNDARIELSRLGKRPGEPVPSNVSTLDDTADYVRRARPASDSSGAARILLAETATQETPDAPRAFLALADAYGAACLPVLERTALERALGTMTAAERDASAVSRDRLAALTSRWPLDAPPDTTGANVTANGIKRAIRAKMDGVRACYDELLRREPERHGRIVVRFVIEESGQVDRATTSQSELGDATLDACVLDVIRSLEYPEHACGIVIVNYPFMFTSSSD